MKPAERRPQSVFETRSTDMVDFLKGEYRRSKEGEKQISSLYPHQVEAVLRLKDYFESQKNLNGNNIGLVVLPTGCGKTGVAVLASYALSASRVLVITPSIIISRQIDKAYGRFLIDHGVIKDTPKDTQDTLPTKSLIKKSTEIEEGMRSMVMVVNAHKIGNDDQKRHTKVKIEDIPREGYDLVIVDEAHHYPAPTWKAIVHYFYKSRRLFLTATPENKGEPILPIPPCYELKRSVAIVREIVRDVMFDETTGGDLDKKYRYKAIAARMEQYLNFHDRQDPSVKHQGMVLTQTKTLVNPAETFCDIYNELFPDKCAVYVSETRKDILDMFKDGKIRTLVIIGRLLEGFDHKPVSVLGIVRNIAPTSRVLFAQFVGRAVRMNHPNDPVPAQIVTHESFDQLQNYNMFEKLAEEDPDDDDN